MSNGDELLQKQGEIGLGLSWGEWRFKDIVGPLISLCLMSYFIYHIFQGERGLYSWLRLQQRVVEEEKVLTTLQSEREVLERQVYLLRPDSLDLDMLEERVRLILNFARSDEIIIHDKTIAEPKKK